MEYGFTSEGNKMLDEARTRDVQHTQEAIRLQEEDKTEFVRNNGGFTPDIPERQLDAPDAELEFDVSEFVPFSPMPSENTLETLNAEQNMQVISEQKPQQLSPDSPEMMLEPLQPESQYAVRERETVQRVQDSAPGLIGEFTAGMTYDPVVTKYETVKVSQSGGGKNYDRFTAPEPEKSFDDKLESDVQNYRKQQEQSYEEDMQSSPLYRRSISNRYG